MSLHAEAGEEIDAFHMDALFLHDAHGQQRIQSAGYEGYGFALHGWVQIIRRCRNYTGNSAHTTFTRLGI